MAVDINDLLVTDPAPGEKIRKIKAVSNMDGLNDMWAYASAAAHLKTGTFKISTKLTEDQAYKACVGWAMAHYKWTIKNGRLESTPANDVPKLVVPEIVRHKIGEIKQEIAAAWHIRDLINMPANVLNTKELAREAVTLASEFNAAAHVVKGKRLEKEFPLVHAVGRASANKPRLVHFSWTGSGAYDDAPSILIVGKGVTFDTGGAQIKPGASMAAMKKDMGGAAHALGLARMVMGNDLPVRLQVVIPIAENAVSGNAFLPGDVYTARDGTEVEIGHTDAEGRLILADALAFGVEQADPDMIIDFATLTGAQRVADGNDVAGVFSNSKAAGRKMEDLGGEWNDDIQFHHLFEVYRPLIKSKNGGEITNSASSGPGATTAAMFLQHFIRAARKESTWFHFDISASSGGKAGRAAGGTEMGLRASYRFLKNELNL